MKFIDEAKIFVKAGDGGKGCVSFRREKYVPRGGPDGGSGGWGGSVIIEANPHLRTLLELKYRQHHVAKRGGHGKGSNKTGEDAPDLVIPVPAGTVIIDVTDETILADLASPGDRYVVARGGMGGKGNAWFATSTHQAPRFAQEGIAGEERWVRLELKLLAEVGIIGLPNVGKSSFISRVSAAKPKIADYPFTTLIPNLGVARYNEEQSLVLADIPGLIRGAHLGAGMGIQFLRHIERTLVLLHILDISVSDNLCAWDDYQSINQELGHFSPSLVNKPQVVAVNKIDLPTTRKRLRETADIFSKNNIRIFPFSAATGEGVRAIMDTLMKTLNILRAEGK